ncbi:MAG: tripartite tricarboxylate transporter substrate binding protein [Burkholderiales bacterium]|nr:tripartite tricarboxylate transporter substrate binding protein [Burkholderiales bacterium]
MKFLLACLAALGSIGSVQAQIWPAKPVRVIVNMDAGGMADVTARVLATRLAETLGQPFVVENRPGGSGYVGFDAAVSAEPDGHNFVFAPGSTMMMAPHIVKRTDLDPIEALVPVAPTGSVSQYVVLHTGMPVQTFREFLAHARANPGKLNYGSPGAGTSVHIAVEAFSRATKVRLNHIPYKGVGPVLRDLVGGQIQLAFAPGVVLPYVKTGKLRLVAVVGPARHPDFPGVPTLRENAIEGVDDEPYFGFYARAGSPRPAIEGLNREVAKVMKEPAVRERFKALTVNLAEPMTPQQFAGYVRAEYARYGKLISDLKILN